MATTYQASDPRVDRIIQHLNKDHQESLSLYLQHYKSLPASASSNPLVTDISFDALTISAKGKTYSIPFDPPMKSWADARERTVDMDRASRAGLGLSSIKITAYEPPRGPIQIGLFVLCLFTLLVNLAPGWFAAGTWFHDTVLPWFPGGPEWFAWAARVAVLPMQVAHFGEAYLLDRTRLRKYGVERGSALWWKWIVSCSFEGFGCFQRIDGEVRRKTLEADKNKH
ncbi:hypothetical protein D0Z07_8171 [Hyphodiscus hymeniophilus]|uniref:DUF2470 domain-containing protein n=1 Tax=Hyphodiscus hymeniophilus TaxID=353542 RepID=A0A9P6SNP4_9HELO|nr:hypothetical protein D0Z07_8171 [Hyphodiscus hymeniophilus]